MNALFRCDATADIGFGHLSRCMALAEGLRIFSVDSVFAGQFDVATQDQIALAGFESVGLTRPLNSEPAEHDFAANLAKQTYDLCVIDSYRADDRYLSILKAHGHRTVVIDDFRKLESYDCDAILNFTWEAPQLDYPDGPVQLMGPEYLLVRRKMVEARRQSIERSPPDGIGNLLIAIGGSDPKGITSRIARLLRQTKSDVCVRAIAQCDDELTSLLKGFATGSGVVARQPDLSEQFLWADAAITGGGLIKYESAYMGVPAAAIAQNEGQDGETQVFSGAGLVFDLGLADRVSDEQLADALLRFLSDANLRNQMVRRMRRTFIADPTAKAAKVILEATRR